MNDRHSEDKFPTQERILGRYTNTTFTDAQKIQRIILEVGEPIPANALTRTDHTDYDRMRGIPAIGRGVRGAIPGTIPHTLR